MMLIRNATLVAFLLPSLFLRVCARHCLVHFMQASRIWSGGKGVLRNAVELWIESALSCINEPPPLSRPVSLPLSISLSLFLSLSLTHTPNSLYIHGHILIHIFFHPSFVFFLSFSLTHTLLSSSITYALLSFCLTHTLLSSSLTHTLCDSCDMCSHFRQY